MYFATTPQIAPLRTFETSVVVPAARLSSVSRILATGDLGLATRLFSR